MIRGRQFQDDISMIYTKSPGLTTPLPHTHITPGFPTWARHWVAGGGWVWEGDSPGGAGAARQGPAGLVKAKTGRGGRKTGLETPVLFISLGLEVAVSAKKARAIRDPGRTRTEQAVQHK